MLGTADVQQQLARVDTLPAPTSPAEFARLIRIEYDNNARIVKTANIRAD